MILQGHFLNNHNFVSQVMDSNISSFIVSNGLQVIYLPSTSSVTYCGFVVRAGTRDELIHQFGLAHFVEHMLFKGTKKRKSRHIINRMENVGGELNAYTTKEETFLYTTCLSEETDRAMELLSDLVFHSVFPPSEIEREKEVVLDEINSCKDNPSEFILDEFENLVFQKSEIGHSIFGEKENLNALDSFSCFEFYHTFYHPENMVFFFYGKTSFATVFHLAHKYFQEKQEYVFAPKERKIPPIIPSIKERRKTDLHQVHVMIGGRGYDCHHIKKVGLILLNNVLGGPGMNNRLNISLREKRGLVYAIESGLTFYSDTGIFNIYFGCDHELVHQCLELTYEELRKLCRQRLTDSQLQASIKQLKGQLGIESDCKETFALEVGKSFLYHNSYDDLSTIYKKMEALKSSELLEIANEIFDEKNLFQLIFE